MAQEKLAAHVIREMFRLRFGVGLSLRLVAHACDVSVGTATWYCRRAQGCKLGWPLPDGMDDDALYHTLFAARKENRCRSKASIGNDGMPRAESLMEKPVRFPLAKPRCRESRLPELMQAYRQGVENESTFSVIPSFSEQEDAFIRRMLQQHEACLRDGGMPKSKEELYARMRSRIDRGGSAELLWLYCACNPSDWDYADKRMMLATSEIYKKYQACPEDDRQFSIGLIAQSIIEAEPEDTAALFSLISRLAQEGSAFALCVYGMLFEHGIGIKCNQAAARICYRNSALGGCTKGMLRLHDHITDIGNCDPQEEEEAVFWQKIAVSRGDWSAFAAQSISTHDACVWADLWSKTRDNAMRGEQRAQFVLGMYHFNKRKESDMPAINHHALAVMWWSLAARDLGSRKSGYNADAIELLALAKECDTARKNHDIGIRMAAEYLAAPRPWFVTVEILDKQILVEPLPGVLVSSVAQSVCGSSKTGCQAHDERRQKTTVGKAGGGGAVRGAAGAGRQRE